LKYEIHPGLIVELISFFEDLIEIIPELKDHFGRKLKYQIILCSISFFTFTWVTVWFARSMEWISKAFRFSNHNWRWWDHDNAMETLRDRYAKGEISKEEYDRMRGDLGK
jgi:uncharacterized membrane protein